MQIGNNQQCHDTEINSVPQSRYNYKQTLTQLIIKSNNQLFESRLIKQ